MKRQTLWREMALEMVEDMNGPHPDCGTEFVVEPPAFLDPLEQLEAGRSMWVHPEWRRVR